MHSPRTRYTTLLMPLALILTVGLAACSPQPQPTWGPGSPGYHCGKMEHTYQVWVPGIPGTIASITVGSKVCTQNSIYLLSSEPYASMNKKGVGNTPAIDQGLEFVGTDWTNQFSSQWTATWRIRSCPVGSFWWLSYLCQPTTHLHVRMGFTTITHIGPNGVIGVWTDGGNDVRWGG